MEKPAKIWSVEITDNELIFHQKGKTLTVKIASVEQNFVDLCSGHTCGGCNDLPIHGYRSSKCNWCLFSRRIANIYEEGGKWVDDEPRKQYLIILTKYIKRDREGGDFKILVEDVPVDVKQKFFLFKGKKKALKHEIKKYKSNSYGYSGLRVLEVKNNEASMTFGKS